MPIFAECGGYMVLGDALVDVEGMTHPMAGLIPGRSRMSSRLQSFGYKRLTALQDNLLCSKGDRGKAHEFHHSVWEGDVTCPAWESESLRGDSLPEGHSEQNLLASYAHIHFGANPQWSEEWVKQMRAWFTSQSAGLQRRNHESARQSFSTSQHR